MRAGWAAALLLALAACAGDGPVQGTRGACAQPSGELIGCEPEPVENAEEVCWRLVDCGVIPVEDPRPDDQEFTLDWPKCVSFVDRLSAERYGFVLDCVSASTCDDLKVDRSPTTPSRGDESLPLCFQFGRQ